MPSSVLKDFAGIGSDKLISSSTPFKLYLFILAELLEITNCLYDFCLSVGSNGSSSELPYDLLVSTLSAEYIMEFMGRSLLDGDDFLYRLVNEFVKFVNAGDTPSSASEFLLSLFEVEGSSETSRALPLSGEAHSVRLQSNELQVNFQNQGEFFPTDARTLQLFLSKEGTVNIILELLYNHEGYFVTIPAGHRDDEYEQENDGGFGCFKNALLLAPDWVLSPKGKKRAEKCFGDHEHTNQGIRRIFDNCIKSVSVKSVLTKNAHGYAMKKNESMIGVFHSGGGGKHCVFIDGHANDGDGTISDPVEGYGNKEPRTGKTLRKMGISKITEVHILNRKHLSKETRKKNEKKLKLPF